MDNGSEAFAGDAPSLLKKTKHSIESPAGKKPDDKLHEVQRIFFEAGRRKCACRAAKPQKND